MQTKNRRCAYCKKKVPTESAKINGLKAFCSTDHAIAWLNSENGSIALKKAQRAKLQAEKQSFLTKSDHIKLAQTAINAWVRWRDRNLGCISCGSKPAQRYGGSMDAGHYRSRGAAGHLRFHLWNIHAQCKKCNRNLSGNVVEYRIRLIQRIGLDKVEWLENNNEIKSFSIDYLERLTKVFKKRLRINKKVVDE